MKTKLSLLLLVNMTFFSMSADRMRTIVLFLIITLASSVQASALPNIAVQLSSNIAYFKTGQSIPVTVSITNQSAEPVNLLKWSLPISIADGSMLRVTQNGIPVTYLGALYKRHAPTIADYITIASGQKISQSIEIAHLFDVSSGGIYTIEYKFHSGNPIAYTNAKTILTTPGATLNSLESSPVHLTIEATFKKLMQQNKNDNIPPEKTATYVSCSETQQRSLGKALPNATDYATNSYNHLIANPNGSMQYVQWFGVYDTNRKQIVNTHFANEQSAFMTQAIVFDCSCNDDYYAYVYPSRPYKIYLCNKFWIAPDLGTDSKAGTLIHEMSHFTVVAATNDYVYGQTGAAALAISDPTKAIMNADNHEYFAEGLGVTFTVTPTAGANGSISPNTSQLVEENATIAFTVAPNSNYATSTTVGGTCPQGSWSGNVWTTGAIVANCTVDFAFIPLLPTVVTNTASNIIGNSVVLNGQVNSNGFTATVTFNFGVTTEYGESISATPSTVYSNTPVAVSANKTGLICNKTYHFRCTAESSAGTSWGLDQEFSTSTCHLCGDSDTNNIVNIVDALAIARYVVNLPPPPAINMSAADVNGDGQVTIADALLIAKRSVGLAITGTCWN